MQIWNKFWQQLKKFKPRLGLAAAVVLAVMWWPATSSSSLAASPGSDGLTQLSRRLPLPNQLTAIDWSQIPSLAGLELSSLSAVVVELPSGRLLGALEPDLALPIASLTKLMTSVIILEAKLPLEARVRLEAADNSSLVSKYAGNGESISSLKAVDGELVRVRDLIAASLISSANNAAAALARSTGLTGDSFVKRMNERARVLGMTEAEFVDPTGLEPANTATAGEVALLARYTWRNRLLRQLSGSPSFSFTSRDGREYQIRNTNPLFRRSLNFKLLASKTGYLEEAGYNLAAEVKTDSGQRYLIVLLSAPSLEDRNTDVEALVGWLERRT
ncbi:MAG: D-alanyl-D-alanine carboxypeptidase [Candidatus Kerfeldbacteria bacterium]|nr:D-alanyl-D-alanine carboxypeptidase [Candidatus Kerfeldbacteria bacterium]